MTESMKFGPEWLRALSSQQPARYQLAEFRYGREEMLALFSANLPPPESLKQLHGLYVEKAQPPLALNTMTDEETRMWNRGINSDVVLRSVGKGGERGGGLRGAGGAGGGRGGRGRGAFYRGSTERYEEGGDAPFSRQRPFDRSQSERGRDSWSERNGGEGRGGGRESNWRRGQRTSGGGDDEDWRPYKWSMTGRSNNWRDEDSYDGNQTHSSSKGGNHHLPEWATEKNSEGGGTFDASGAFHGASEQVEEEESKKNENSIFPYSESKKLQKTRSLRIKKRNTGRERDKLLIGKGELMEKGSKEEKRTDLQENPKEAKPPEKDEEPSSASESVPSPIHSPSKQPPLNSQMQQSSPRQQLPSQQSPPQQNSQVKTPTPSSPSGSPLPSPHQSEKKSPAHQPPQGMIHHSTPTQELKSPIHQHHLQQHQHQHQHQQPQPPPPVPQPPEHQEDLLGNMTDDLAADLVAKLMEDEEKQDKQWYYRDPQGQVQGPFTCIEMAEWFQSGYFTLNLLVRRACDPNYAPLGELIKLWGCIPFLPDVHPLNKECAALLNNQFQDHYVLHHYQQHMRSLFYRQQQQPRALPQPAQVPKLQHDWLDSHQANLVEPVLPPQYQPQVGVNALHQHTNTNNHLRALLAQLQQQAKSEPAPSPVVDTLMSLAHQQQAAAVSGQTPIQALLRHMQQQSTKLQHHQQVHPAPTTGIDSVWNGGGNWNQWGHVNTKGIKTEQQVLEEQLRAEFLRKREDLLKAAEEEEAKGKEEEEKVKKEREKQQEAVKREEENLARRRAEEEEIRKKQEASRRAEVERQKKGEEKRRKEEEKRKKEEEKRKKEEENRERERLREEERKKKEAEEAKKRAQQAADVMAKVQRSQWCPPAASNTSILDIQRSEREQQQILRGLQQAAAQQHLEQQQQTIGSKGGLQLKWTDPSARPQAQVESLADIQAEQQRQFLKQLEKEKEREKEKAAVAAAAAAASASQSLGSWSQGLAWGSSAWQSPAINPMSSLQSSKTGFWEYDKSSCGVGGGGGSGRLPQQQSEPPKSVQNKAKREELAVMKLFNQSEEDEFSMWCTRQLSALQANVEITTFIQFLREIESPSEVAEYVRLYLGETKEASDFARQFIERRAAACGGRTNPGAGLLSSSQDDRDFQQVKGKSKKTKKGRMQKVDTRMLGFSTTAAPDRINVGDREYPE